MGKTRIEYADYGLSVTAGCEKCSPGCAHCYAERMAWRLCGMAGPLVYDHNPSTLRPYKRVVAGGRWNGNVVTIPEALDKPKHWRKPRIVFVNPMSDLFHPKVPFEFIHEVWNRMKACPQHAFLILTKRAERMLEVVEKIYTREMLAYASGFWDHVWHGVTVCNQAEADENLAFLARCRARHKWVSIEPMLGALDMGKSLREFSMVRDWPQFDLDWVVLGGETGPGARQCRAEWALSVRDQCLAAGIPLWLKQIDRFNGRPLPKELPPELAAIRRSKT